MTSRERVIRTLSHQSVDRAPRDLWMLPGVVMFRSDGLERIYKRFPQDFVFPPFRYGPAPRAKGVPAVRGEYSDAWGVVWRVGETGVIGEVKEPILKTEADILAYELPWELLNEADVSEVDSFCAKTDAFCKAGTDVRPFERFQFLRGTEAAMMDLASGDEAAMGLLRRLHDYYCKELEIWTKTAVDGVGFLDDWGSQNSLLISPNMWREIFRPFYKDYCDILHGAGKWVFFHSDGHIEAIYQDLIDIGIDAVNSQLFCMDIESVGERFGGKITFWGEIDRQYAMTTGSPEDVRQAVYRVRRALDKSQGGVIAQCEWGNDTPEENVAAVYEAWLAPREAFATTPVS